MTSETIDAADAATEIVSGKEATRARKETNGVVTCTVTVNSGDPTDIRISRAKSLAEVSVPQPIPNVFPLFPRGDPLYAVVDGDSGDKANVETRVGRTVGEASNAYVRATTFAVSAEGTTEVNADQTASIAAGDSQTSTVTADNGEVWNITGFKFFWNADSDWDGSAADGVEVTVQSEQEAVEYAHAFANVVSSGEELEFVSNTWQHGGSSLQETRVDVKDHRIDDTNGVEVVVNNQSPNTNVGNKREIRFEFDILKV